MSYPPDRQTKRLRLRRFQEDDLDWLFRLDNDPEVMRYINGGIATPLEFIQDSSLPYFLDFDPGSPGFGFWVIERAGQKEPAGWCCLRPGKTGDCASLGYRLVRSSWGHGFATEASRELIRIGFEELGLESIYASTYEHNRGSRKVLEKLGFHIHREYRVDLSEQPTAYFDSTEPWPGLDFEYRLARVTWTRVSHP